MKRIGIAAAAAFVSTVWAANYAVQHWGFVPVGFGLEAPAGVYFVGVAFTLRDTVQHTLGRRAVLACIAAGTLLAAWLSNAYTVPGGHVDLAVASAAAFACSELADLAVYTPLRARTWLGAVAASNTIGLVLDSVLFLWLAFGSLAFLRGQIVGKAWMTLVAIALLAVIRAGSRRTAEALA